MRKRFTKNTPWPDRYDIQPNGCWHWRGTIHHLGYGVCYVEGQRMQAHRASYLHHVGPITPGLYVCHSCDVKHCVNPNHLWLGTHQENTIDAYRKGIVKVDHLQTDKRGSNNGRYKHGKRTRKENQDV